MSDPTSSPQQGDHRPWRRYAALTATGVAVVLVLALVAGIALWVYAGRQIERRDIAGVGDDRVAEPGAMATVNGASRPEPLEGTLNVLAVGTDSREGLTDEQLLELGTEEVAGERADTVILVHLSPERPGPVMISFPRDLRVLIPGHGPGKLNAALAYGGPDLLVETVESYSAISVDHYVQVDIAGFLDLVDIVGGVPVCLDEALVDRHAGADFPAGRHVLDGAQAAAFVRARKSDPRGDLGRIERQQAFVRQAMRKVISAGTLVNPLRVKRLVDAAGSALLTDRAFGTSEMVRVAWSVRNLDPSRVAMHTVPAVEERIDGLWYAVADPEQAEALFQVVRTGGDLPGAGTPSSTPSPPPAIPPGDVRVAVLNGAGVQGLAAEAASQLRDAGFEIAGIGNVGSFGMTATEVRYAPGHEAEAQTVARRFRDATVAESDAIPGDAHVAVALGERWAEERTLVDGVGQTPVPSPPTPAPSGSALRGECA